MLKNASSTPSGRSIRVQLARERLRRGFVEIIEDVPAEDAVDGVVFLREALREKRRERLELALGDVPIDVLEQILDDDLAAKLLAEERDVGADDRAEVEQQPAAIER